MSCIINNSTEHLVGYDVRIQQSNILSISLYGQENCSMARLRNPRIWPSRFADPNQPAYEFLKANNFREPSLTSQIRNNYKNIIVPSSLAQNMYVPTPFEHSWQFTLKGLWDNLGNMLCRYRPVPELDMVVAFTIFDFHSSKYAILCGNHDIAKDDERLTIDQGVKPGCTDFVHQAPSLWSLLGYDVGCPWGSSPFCFSLEIPTEITTIEEYDPTTVRNEYLLLDELELAHYECRLANAYSKECPYYVWGVYVAKDVEALTKLF